MMVNNSKFTLKELLSTYNTTIPAIQRDYAFGRKGINNTNKRTKFISKLINSIQNSKLEHLDFVYGLIENNEFIPLDGQQRITTLWLIEIYIMKNYDTEKDYSFLNNFSYDTRTSTREFCESLILEEWNLTSVSKDNGEVVNYFYNLKWFFNSWRHDPTIKGMVVVLEEIHKCFDDIYTDNINTDEITFSFMDIDELGSPEELYVKMNSRGKELSKWDLFKVNLFEYVEELKQIEDIEFDIQSYEEWIDKTYIDYFWSLGKDENDKAKNTESRMLRFFNMFMYTSVIERVEDFETTKSSDITDLIRFDWKSIIDIDFLNEIRNFIDFIKINEEAISVIEYSRFVEDGIKIKELKDMLRKPEFNTGYLADIDLFYSYKCFIKKTVKNNRKVILASNNELEELQDIIRITSNFEEPYRKQFTIEKVFLASIKKAIQYDGGILNYFANEDLTKVSFGTNSSEQKQEEIYKAKLIKNEPTWKNAILAVESHPYFNGTIGWLLMVNKSLELPDFIMKSGLLLDKFNEHGIKDKTEISNILKYKDIKMYNDLFPKNNRDGGSNNLLRDFSWKKLFRGYGQYINLEKENDLLWVNDWLDESDYTITNDLWRNWLIAYPRVLNLIGGIRTNTWADSRFFGVYWSVQRYSSKKYDIPLLTAKVYIEGVQYVGFMSEGEESFATYKDKKITFNYDNESFVVTSKGEMHEVTATDIDSLISSLKNYLIV